MICKINCFALPASSWVLSFCGLSERLIHDCTTAFFWWFLLVYSQGLLQKFSQEFVDKFIQRLFTKFWEKFLQRLLQKILEHTIATNSNQPRFSYILFSLFFPPMAPGITLDSYRNASNNISMSFETNLFTASPTILPGSFLRNLNKLNQELLMMFFWIFLWNSPAFLQEIALSILPTVPLANTTSIIPFIIPIITSPFSRDFFRCF